MAAGTTTSCLVLFLLGIAQALPIKEGEEHQATVNETMNVGDIIIKMNTGSTEFLVEGDVLVPRKRTAMKCYRQSFSCLWPKSRNGLVEIPYLIDKIYGHNEVATIEAALKGFHSKTCIRFIPRRTQNVYIDFEPRSGCFSSMGRIGDRQVISLHRFGCVHYGIIQHEVMHALGFYHEHMRSDRDQHIRIHWENINKYNLLNFVKKDTNNLGTPYDYKSVMHYGRMAFTSRWGSPSMTPIPDASVPIGQRDGLSTMDIARVNKLYNCRSTY